MDIQIVTKMLKDKNFTNYQKMKYKYSQDFSVFLHTLEELYYKPLPLLDFDGHPLVFIENHAVVNQNAVKLLLQSQDQRYGLKAAEDEIVATSAIESVDFTRDSVRKILKGMAPQDEQESRILGIKHGLEFIADTTNKITEENLYRLYQMTVGDFLVGGDKLADGQFYRHDTVYVISDHVEHTGLAAPKIPEYMKSLMAFINSEDDLNDLIKAAIIHFYMGYIHPYFDGNGRMARLLHLWFLIQRDYQSTLFVPFSSQIEKSRKAYYNAYTTIEDNKKYSGKIDVTPFVLYFIKNVYNNIPNGSAAIEALAAYDNALKSGKVTKKETELWKFVLSFYGTEEFSTKQLEKDFGNAAYATISAFVLKFEELGLLSPIKYGTRTRYRLVK